MTLRPNHLNMKSKARSGRAAGWTRLGVMAATALLVTQAARTAHAKTCMSAADLVAIKTPFGPQISPNGRWVAFTVKASNQKTNSNTYQIYVVSSNGGPARRLANTGTANMAPAWSPDGSKLAFVSNRSGKPQVWILPFAAGGEARQFTHLPQGASDPRWSPDGRFLLVTSDVKRPCALRTCKTAACRNWCNGKSHIKAKVFNHLFYRSWNHWTDKNVSHVFKVDSRTGKTFDVTPGQANVPPLDLGTSHDYVASPDGRSIAYVKNTDRIPAASTNNDIFLVTGAPRRPRRLTRSHAAQAGPRFSPDGRFLAYKAMVRPGFESDRSRIVIFDLRSSRTRTLLRTFDRSVNDFVWAPDGKTIYFTAEDRGHVPVFAVPVTGGPARTVVQKVFARSLRISKNGRFLVFGSQAADRPPELFRFDLAARRLRPITHFNDWFVQSRYLGKLTSFWYRGAAGQRIQTFVLKPAKACTRPGRIPVVMMIHGGPQGMLGDDFHPRWNSQMFAAPGYAIVMVNFHGSVGYGQAFTNSISGDWGGKPYKDIMMGLKAALKHDRSLDGNRVCAAGASYGGYMIAWIGGHTKRFKCLVTHDGVYDLTSMYGGTEELWFPEWEFRGTPWGRTRRSQYQRWSPNNYVQHWVTPTLIIHGQQDFRVPVTQGMELFTALQRRGVPSRFLYYPDEYHFVTKPKNRLLWWSVVHNWLGRYLRHR
ncbi:MAG: S9 family peptidase [Deltaproteobacteria bacterium]|nr:S9 family peptidase [Deltaproteobacteria bacterium]